MQSHHVIFSLTPCRIMLQSTHIVNGGVMSMNSVASILEQIQTEIQRVRDYLMQLEETERKVAKLVITRQQILGDLPVEEASVATNESPQQPVGTPVILQSPPPLPFDILKVLSTAGRTMSFAKIHQELEEIRGPVTKNALTSTLSRLAHEHRIKRPSPGKYAVMTPRNVTEEAARLRGDSIPSLAYVILREAGSPRTIDQIWALLKERKPDATKGSLSGSLYNNSKIGRIFILVGPKTFGLREWQKANGSNQDTSRDTEIPLPGGPNSSEAKHEGQMPVEDKQLVYQFE